MLCLPKDKCSYYLNYDIASHFLPILVSNEKKLEFYTILIDESLNLIMQMGQINLVVTFWDNIVNKVCTGYLGSTFVDHA